MNLSDKERMLLKQYETFSSSRTSLINRLAVEVVPAIIFITLGLYTEKVIWFIVLIMVMVTYNVQRILRQNSYSKSLNSIAHKALRAEHESKK